jgi:hypothetical protein
MFAWTVMQAGDWLRESNNSDSPWYDGPTATQTELAAIPNLAAGDTVYQNTYSALTISSPIAIFGGPAYAEAVGAAAQLVTDQGLVTGQAAKIVAATNFGALGASVGELAVADVLNARTGVAAGGVASEGTPGVLVI